MGKNQLMKRGEIICYFGEHFQAAFETVSRFAIEAKPIIRTAPGAADYAGVQFLWDLIKLAQHQSREFTDVVLDCGENPATVFGALRTGWKNISYSGSPQLQQKVASLLSRYGGQIIPLNEGPDLDLQHSADPSAECILWLEGLQK